MVNKDQLEQTPEGKQVLALMAENFTTEQFQPALTLIEQLYTEDQPVWDATINHDSKHPFNQTRPDQRLLLFFLSPGVLANAKNELERRETEARIKREESQAQQQPPPPVKKTTRKRSVKKTVVKKKIAKRPAKKSPAKRPKVKTVKAKAKKPAVKKKRKR